MTDGMPMMLLVVGVLGAGAVLFMKRCELLGICDQEEPPVIPPPPLPPVPVPEEDEDGQPSVTNQTVIINAQGRREYVPYPVFPLPLPRPAHGPRCDSRIRRHGTTYTLTKLSRMPAFQIAVFPPMYIKDDGCIYQRTGEPKERVIEDDCCKCKTTGYDSHVECTTNKGRTWTIWRNHKYDLEGAMDDCKDGCKSPPSSPLPRPFPDKNGGPAINCNNPYCRQYPSRCPHCTQPPSSKANYGSLALYSNRMSLG